MSVFVGIDVGGTNTDAVIIETKANSGQYRVIAARKCPSTSEGVVDALKAVLPSIHERSQRSVVGVFIGTTQFVNAILERSEHLSKVVYTYLCLFVLL